MQERIVSDGERRLRNSPEFQARLRELEATITARYAAELASAGFIRRFLLRLQIASELREAREKLGPSKRALYIEAE